MKKSLSKIRQFFSSIVAPIQSSEQSSMPTPHSNDAGDLIPKSSQEAHARLHDTLAQSSTIQELSHDEFQRAWIAIAYIAPALSPDEANSKEGSWPTGWNVIAAEAFRRFEKKELTKEELYPRPKRLL